MKVKPQTGYRLDIKSALTGTYCEYTSLKKPDTLEMTEALARGLKRQGEAGRIVRVTGREKAAADFVELVESWERSVVQPK